MQKKKTNWNITSYKNLELLASASFEKIWMMVPILIFISENYINPKSTISKPILEPNGQIEPCYNTMRLALNAQDAFDLWNEFDAFDANVGFDVVDSFDAYAWKGNAWYNACDAVFDAFRGTLLSSQ